MNLEQQYRLQEYQDLGKIGTKETIRLKRNKIYGIICVEKRVPAGLRDIYEFLKTERVEGVPEIFECIPDGNELIVIEKYIEGCTLEDRIHESVIAEKEAVRIALKLCDILNVLHHAEHPIICRDLKAENIMIDQNQNIWLVDFDIARTFQEGKRRDTELLGTAEYAAPEQFGFFQTDSRTDIYAIGILLNYILTGKFPVEKVVTGKMAEIVQKCTFLEPGKRYQDICELKNNILTLYPEYESCPVKKKEAIPFTIPGFRTNTFWKKVVAVLGYLLITYVCFTIEFESETIKLTAAMLRIEQAVIWISQIFFVGIACDYRGCKRGIPLLNHESRLIQGVGYVIVEFLLLFIAVFICVILEMVIFGIVC